MAGVSTLKNGLVAISSPIDEGTVASPLALFSTANSFYSTTHYVTREYINESTVHILSITQKRHDIHLNRNNNSCICIVLKQWNIGFIHVFAYVLNYMYMNICLYIFIQLHTQLYVHIVAHIICMYVFTCLTSSSFNGSTDNANL